jgi:hypothetical protein
MKKTARARGSTLAAGGQASLELLLTPELAEPPPIRVGRLRFTRRDGVAAAGDAFGEGSGSVREAHHSLVGRAFSPTSPVATF